MRPLAVARTNHAHFGGRGQDRSDPERSRSTPAAHPIPVRARAGLALELAHADSVLGTNCRQFRYIARETSHGGREPGPPWSEVRCGWRCSASLSNSIVKATTAKEISVDSGSRRAMDGSSMPSPTETITMPWRKSSWKWKRRPKAALNPGGCPEESQGGFDLEAPRFQQRFGDVLRVPVPASPFAEPSGADILIGSELELLDDLLKGSHGGHDRADRLGLTPVWIATTLCMNDLPSALDE